MVLDDSSHQKITTFTKPKRKQSAMLRSNVDDTFGEDYTMEAEKE